MSKRSIRSNKGAAMVELAIILPILLLVLFGIIEISLILYNKAMITNASREGARAGIVFYADPNTGNYSPLGINDIPPRSGIRTIVNNYLANYLVSFSGVPATANTTVVPAQCPPLTATPPRQIAVTVTYPYTFLVLPNFVARLFGLNWLNQLNLSAVTVMRCE